jgi:2-dehydropantoate 2-reductase
MRFVVFGAGGIGGTIGARLAMSGAEVLLIARGAHHDALRDRGLRFIAPDGTHELRLPVVAGAAEVEWRAGDVVLLAVKSQHTTSALEALGTAPPTVPVICAQNGVANERMAARVREHVYGMVVNLPALHLQPGEVVTHAGGTGGILDLGCFPGGVDDRAAAVAQALARAGFSAEADPAIMRWKHAKLLMNLGNGLQAAVVGTDAPDTPHDAVIEVGRRLRREALACYAAAGIVCATREEVAARHEGTYRMVEIEGVPRVGGSSWQSVQRGTGDIETDYLNGEICLLGTLHGVPTPANRVVQQLANRLVRERLPVGSFAPEAVLEMIDAA